MSDQPKDEVLPTTIGEISAAASAQAPIIFFEEASAFGHFNGALRITLEAQTLRPSLQGLVIDRVIVAHLRMTVPAALSLKKTIEDALLLAAPPAGAS